VGLFREALPVTEGAVIVSHPFVVEPCCHLAVLLVAHLGVGHQPVELVTAIEPVVQSVSLGAARG